MIVKKRSKPIRLLTNEALLRRIPPDFPTRSEIEADFKKRKAGYRGEQALDYHLSMLDDRNYIILQDLRLPIYNTFFQIDTLILTPHYALVIEVKNMAGTLLFDTKFNQLIRIYRDKQEGFTDPITQVKLQAQHLAKFLEPFHYTLPIKTLVVISNPSTIIKAEDEEAARTIQNQVIHAYRLPTHIQELPTPSSKPHLDSKALKKLVKLFAKFHSTPHFDMKEAYQVHPSDIKDGVQCPNCHHIPMKRVSTKWSCPMCMETTKTAHIQAIFDYFLLCSPYITTRAAANFLQVTSVHLAYRLLSNMNLKFKGKTKARLYHSPFLD
ncbi:nuclease-related domain-containing protein [Bacillus pinisoli]|uniref:nuclease-related domain-containing protein n=1 Tax=Bacillus pinisoli TaxID=2901866 RepID=UPI001FF1A03E|nr:nuclease-related domain-containing protein [Bacillus pinisoli]